MEIKEFIEKLNVDLKNLRLRIEELKILNGPKYDRLWAKKELKKAVENIAEASMIVCGMYPDENGTPFEEI